MFKCSNSGYLPLFLIYIMTILWLKQWISKYKVVNNMFIELGQIHLSIYIKCVLFTHSSYFVNLIWRIACVMLLNTLRHQHQIKNLLKLNLLKF